MMVDTPTYANISYGPHTRNVLDVWLADSPTPSPVYVYYHGGGFINGDKRSIPPILLEGLLAAGVSVASVNYRFSDDPELFATLLDGQYSLQFLRAQAEAWRLDRARFAAGGDSAGSCHAFWLGFRPDMADPASTNPVARQSTRLTCLASWEPQTTLDANFIRAFLAGPTWTIASIEKLVQLPYTAYETPLAKARFRELAFTEMVSADTPPVFIYNITPDLPVTPELSIGEGIHHPLFGRVLKHEMDRYGVECILRKREDEPSLTCEDASELFQREMVAFLVRHLIGV